MSNEIVDDEDSDFMTEEVDPFDEPPSRTKNGTDARRRIEELMERRRLKGLIDDPYFDDIDGEL
jgi:hypothetical protein